MVCPMDATPWPGKIILCKTVCANGTLDGGGVYLDGAVRNLQSIGIPAQDACLMASTTPAALLGLPRTIHPGHPAVLVGWSEGWQVERVWRDS